jgi:anti-anti-sigma factor
MFAFHPDVSSRRFIPTFHPDVSSRRFIPTFHPDVSSRRFIPTFHRGLRAGSRGFVTRPEPSCAQFGIEFDYDVDNTILLLHGDLDALSVAAFSGALIALAERGTRFVTIDLSKLRFCSIGGLRAMAELAARLNAVGGGVRILGPSILTRMLDLADVRSLFTVGDPQPIELPIDELPIDELPMELREGALLDPAASRAPRSSRPRASSLHRLSTGA